MSGNAKGRHARGKVYLVGAGPGDPGLVTLKAVELLRAADVVVYDHLVGPETLAFAREGAEMVDAGKSGSRHKLEQDEINELLADCASEGRAVVRLKGGDPFLFGRGGEEAAYLKQRGVDFEVVPGVTSALAVPAAAGIPVTHRGLASAVTIVTGHESPGKPGAAVDWRAVAKLDSTIVVLMGAGNIRGIAEKVVAGGRPGDTPVAVVQNGTTRDQSVVVGTLADIARRAEEAGVGPPAVIVIGDVVKMRENLEGHT